MSQLAGLLSIDYLDLKYTNSVDLSTKYYNQIKIDNLLANKVSTTGDASISSNLTINGNLDSSKKFPLDIKSSTIHTEFWTLASFHQGIGNSGSWLQFSRDGTSNTWQTGMSPDNSYVIRASDATNVLSVNQNGNTTVSGNLDVGSGSSSRIRSHASNNGYTGYAELNIASAWGLWINLETTYPNGGWVYFKINTDNYTYAIIR